MADPITLARPYAKAAFEAALEAQALDEWSRMLGVSAAVAGQPAVYAALTDPGKSRQQAAATFGDLCEGELNAQARNLARENGVDIRYYSIIYDLTEDLKQMLSGMLAPQRRETFLGNAGIKEVFNISKVGRVAGCEISEGLVRRGASVRLLRDNVVIHEGKLATLKRFKNEVREVTTGFECGMAFENYQDLRPGDVIECFEVEEITRTL